MRPEKQFITNEYIARLNSSPFFLIVDYQGLGVLQFTELRKRLAKAGSQIHVVKNSIFQAAAKEVGIADLTGSLNGQLAVVTGQKDVAATAKTLKNFRAEFDKPKIRFGFLEKGRMEAEQILILADLPPLETLRGKLVGLLQTPATRLVQVINAPAQQLARVLQAYSEKGA